MAWRLAGSLIKLRDQVNAAYPGRNKASDGTIGDAAHQAVQSDHNPDSAGVVAAIDITHDPGHGLDIGQMAEALRASRDNRIKYVIANRRIFIPPNWNYQDYTGSSDPHTNHIHVSVNRSNYDDSRDWQFKQGGNMGALEDRIKQLEASEQRLAAEVTARDQKIDTFTIKDTDHEYSRWDRLHSQILGRHQPDRGVFRGAAVGRTWLTADEILSDHPEADAYYADNHLNTGDLTNLMGELGIPNPPNPNDIEFHINQHKASWKSAFYDLASRPDRIRIPDLKAQIDELGKAVAIKDKEIESLKSQVGDNSKWETFKALLRELFSSSK